MKNNIGKLNAIFEQNIDNILKRKNGGKILKEYVLMFTKNKNLLKEYMIFDYIKNINNSENVKDYILESINYLNNVNKSKLLELNEMVYNFMNKNNITQLNEIKDEVLFDDINQLIFTKKNIKTINERVDKLNKITKYIIENNKNNDNQQNEFILSENTSNIDLKVKEFNEKYKGELNEEEKEMFNLIINSKTDESKSKLLEDKRKECLELTNKFLKEGIDVTTKEKLLNVKEKLLEQIFDSKNFIHDITSLLELKQTLSEEL